MKKIDKKNIIFVSVAASLTIFMAAIGSTLAILTQNTETRANNFSFGQVNIKLDEPKWDDKGNDHILYPGRTVPKDPTVTNTGINDLYVFLKVRIPKASVHIVEVIDGKDVIQPEDVMDLVSYKYDEEHWEFIDEYDENYNKSDYHTIIYGYKAILPASPPDKAKTKPLFEEVTFVNAVEGEPKTSMSFNMPIDAYAIQADYLEDVSGNDIKDILTKDILTKAYNLYVKSANS